jgi:hypothetical protein
LVGLHATTLTKNPATTKYIVVWTEEKENGEKEKERKREREKEKEKEREREPEGLRANRGQTKQLGREGPYL